MLKAPQKVLATQSLEVLVPAIGPQLTMWKEVGKAQALGIATLILAPHGQK